MGAFVTGWLTERFWKRLSFAHLLAACAAGGIFVVYVIGIIGLSLIAGLPLEKAAAGSITFIPGDLIKVVIAAFVAKTVNRSYPVIRGLKPNPDHERLTSASPASAGARKCVTRGRSSPW